MRRLGYVVAFGLVMAAGAGFAGCGDFQPPINRVGVNVVEKSAFTGSWYMARTTIDLDYEAAGLGFVGEIARDGTAGFLGFALPRIRWVIDEETLYAYRDYEIVGDPSDPFADADPDPSHLGTPVAAFRILSHFDIRRDYNPVTGEELNVIVENTTDRRWWERRFMRVDWSRNLLTSYFGTSHEIDEIFGTVRREPAHLFTQDESQFPAAWRPQFHFMTCSSVDDTSAGCREDDREWAEDYEHGQLYSFSFVTQEIVSPGLMFSPGFGLYPYCGEANMGMPECASVVVAIRTSFLRVSDRRDYEAVEWTDERHERAGYFRLDRLTYDASRDADDPTWGFTDFSNRGTNRHNIWREWWRRDASGQIVRDESGRPVPLPYTERRVRPIVWYTTPELPAHLVRAAFETVGQWNEVLMATVRQLRGQEVPVYERVSCQNSDPSAYCFCQCDPEDVEAGVECTPDVALNPTCAGRYDPFTPPSEARVESGTPFDCYVEVPAGAEPNVEDRSVAERLSDADYNGWFGARMVGAECVNILRINRCNMASLREAESSGNAIECQERGDIRFKFLSYVDQPGTPFLGVAQLRGDPITGEIITGDANIGGPAMQSQRTRAMQTYDLINGRSTDQEFFTGEDIRAFLEAANRVDLPAPPRIDFSVALRDGLPVDPAIRGEIDRRMAAAMERAERLQGPEGRAQIMSDRLRELAGSDIERRLLANLDTFVLAGMTHVPAGMMSTDVDDEILQMASPFRHDIGETLERHIDFELRTGLNAFHMPNEYTDYSVMWFVTQHRNWPRARVEIELNRRLYRDTQVHEMGHCLGLLHDFGGTTDSNNYADDYYVIDAAYPLPDPRTFDRDGVPGLNPDEQIAFEEAYQERRRIRELAGIDTWMNASVMDYTAQWYERIQGAGYYDRMAIRFGYGDLVDIYHNAERRRLADINPSNTRRDVAKWYMGGERCTTDSDCPFAADGHRASELMPANTAAGLTQRCLPHPTVPGAGVCSNYDEDARALTGRLTDGAEWVPVHFRYCEDIRASTRSLPWCNLFDEGDSFREIVRNAMEAYERNYIFQAFRRYRRTFTIGNYIGGLLRYFWPLISIEQSLLYRYQNEPTFRDEEGPWGFYDQFLATADTLNFFARVLGSPGVGAYVWDEGFQWYRRESADPDAAIGQLQVRLGQGRFFGSVYQAGLNGIYRIERVGSFFDKAITMQLMTFRGLSPFYGADLVFYTNLYDLFPNEINQIFTGMIADQPHQYMPRVRCGAGSSFPTCRNPRIMYMDFYRGDCSTPDSTTCRPHPADITYRDERVINGGDNFLLQSYAAIFGLAQFPVYYDTTFQTQLFLCVEGQGECHAAVGTEGRDYVRYTSSRLGKSFLAWQLTPEEGGTIEQRSIAFAMVLEARNSAFIMRALQQYRGDFGGRPNDVNNIPPADRTRLRDELGYVIPSNSTQLNREIDRLDDRVRQLESFFGYLIQLEREFGIEFPFLYRRPEI